MELYAQGITFWYITIFCETYVWGICCRSRTWWGIPCSRHEVRTRRSSTGVHGGHWFALGQQQGKLLLNQVIIWLLRMKNLGYSRITMLVHMYWQVLMILKKLHCLQLWSICMLMLVEFFFLYKWGWNLHCKYWWRFLGVKVTDFLMNGCNTYSNKKALADNHENFRCLRLCHIRIQLSTLNP